MYERKRSHTEDQGELEEGACVVAMLAVGREGGMEGSI